MSKINVAGLDEIVDIHYRYKMHKLDVTNEKNKTVINNLDKVSTEINREEKMIIYFFKKYFGSNFILKHSKCSTTKKITEKELQDALKEFIEYGVLCPQCRLPETKIKSSKGSIKIGCICCGYNDKIDIPSIGSKPMKDVFEQMIKN